MKEKLSGLYILASGILWGIISIFISGLGKSGFTSIDIVAIRCFLTAVILIVFALIKDKKLLKIKLRDLPFFIGTGVFSIVFFNFCYFKSMEVIGGAALPALLLYTAPIFVMLLSAVFFKEKLTAKKLLALALCFCGLILVTGVLSSDETLTLEAFLFGIGSGFGYGLYSIFGKFVVEKYSSLTITIYTFITAAIVSIPLSGIYTKAEAFLDIKTDIYAILLAVVSTVLPYLLYTEGLKHTEAGKASVIATAEPVVAAIIGATVFSESFSAMKITGMIIIISAILLLNINVNKKTNKKE